MNNTETIRGAPSSERRATPESRDWSSRALEYLRIHDPDAGFELHGIDRLPRHGDERVAALLQAPSSQGILRISWSGMRPTGPIALCTAYLPQDWRRGCLPTLPSRCGRRRSSR